MRFRMSHKVTNPPQPQVTAVTNTTTTPNHLRSPSVPALYKIMAPTKTRHAAMPPATYALDMVLRTTCRRTVLDGNKSNSGKTRE
jgi:hypothetical protein